MRASRKYIRVIKLLLAGVTVFCVSWIASVNEWHTGVRWVDRGSRIGRGGQGGRIGQVEGLATMRTIVAYSEGKQAEMDRPLPVACDRMPAFPKIPYFVSYPNLITTYLWYNFNIVIYLIVSLTRVR